MPAPTSATYSVAVKVAAHTATKDMIDAESGAGSIAVRDDADVLLVEIPLTDPCGSVNGGTGQLSLTASAAGTAVAEGTAAYAEIRDATDVVHLALPCQSGSAAVANKCVLNTLAIAVDDPVEVVAATIG